MGLYNNFKYNGDLYGDQKYDDGDLLWTFQIAWDGYYGWGNEGTRMVDLQVRRGRARMFKTNGQGREPYRPGVAVGVFDNDDGRLDPWNTSSPLYPYVTPGKFCVVAVKDTDTDTDYDIMHGIVTDIQPVRRGMRNLTRITVVDGLQWLKDHLVWEGLNTPTISFPPGQVASQAGWPTSWWGTDYTTHTVQQDYWWSWDQTAFDALYEYTEAEQGAFFHSREGNLVWRPRTYHWNRTVEVDEVDALRDVGRAAPWEFVRNNVQVTAYPLYLDTASDIIWTMRDIPAIADGETFSIEALFRYEDWQPCGSSVSFHYEVNSLASGAGADLTASCSLWYDTDIGEGALLKLTNNSGQPGFIVDFHAHGDSIYTPDVSIIERKDDDSIDLYGTNTLQLKQRWIDEITRGETIADYLLASLKDPSPAPVIRVENRAAIQYTPDLWDRMTLRLPSLGINGDHFRVGQIEHKWLRENGQGVLTTFTLEPYYHSDEDETEADVAYVGVRTYKQTTDQTITTGTDTAVTFNSEVSGHDTDGFHSTSTNTSRLTVPTGHAGYYHVYGQVRWDASALGNREVYIKTSGGVEIARIVHDGVNLENSMNVEATVALNVGDYVELYVKHSKGSDLDVLAGGQNTLFGMDWEGALA